MDSAWVQALLRQGEQLPAWPRLPLLLNGVEIGSVQGDFFSRFVAQQAQFAPGFLELRHNGDNACWSITGEANSALNQIANALRLFDGSGVAHLWRDEQLAVRAASGEILATVERGAVRALGIATNAVHLIGYCTDNAIWIQQRAHNKATDPGKWDTLMGGMVPATDSVAQALERETWEEAGLKITDLRGLHREGDLLMRKPQERSGADAKTAADIGYIVERVDWYSALVPDGLAPQNRDGEVAQFARVSRKQLWEMLQDQQFTVEAALLLIRFTLRESGARTAG